MNSVRPWLASPYPPPSASSSPRPAGARERRRWPLALAPALALLTAGCAQVLGIDDTQRGGGSADAAPADGPAQPIDAALAIDAAPARDFTCADSSLDTTLGEIGLDTAPAGDDVASSCGGDTSPDLLFSWTAPVTDYYSINTYGSGFDTVLAVYDQCGGVERACSNNVGQLSQSEIILKLRQDEQTLLVVDGAAGDSGTGNLVIERVSCPDADLEDQSFPVELSTLGFDDDLTASCGGDGQEDRAYHWVAPADGLYYFRATSDSFRPVVSLIDGPRCQDRVLGCNAAASGPAGAEVVRFVRAGQPLSVIVDGLDGAGLFTLDIGLSPGPTCPESQLPDSGGVVDDFTERSLAPSCGFARQPGPFGGIEEVADNTYAFTAPGSGTDCFGSCSALVSAPQEVAIYALEGGDCGGPEIACAIAIDANGDGLFTAEIDLGDSDDDRELVIVVGERSSLDGGGFDLTTECFVACP